MYPFVHFFMTFFKLLSCIVTLRKWPILLSYIFFKALHSLLFNFLTVMNKNLIISIFYWQLTFYIQVSFCCGRAISVGNDTFKLSSIFTKHFGDQERCLFIAVRDLKVCGTLYLWVVAVPFDDWLWLTFEGHIKFDLVTFIDCDVSQRLK